MILVMLPLAKSQRPNPQPEPRAELLDHLVLNRCIPWAVANTGTPDARQDPLVCSPWNGDDIEEEFLWDWI